MDWRFSHASDQRTCTRCPITFIAKEDIEIVESNDNEDSENDDEDVSTDGLIMMTMIGTWLLLSYY